MTVSSSSPGTTSSRSIVPRPGSGGGIEHRADRRADNAGSLERDGKTQTMIPGEEGRRRPL